MIDGVAAQRARARKVALLSLLAAIGLIVAKLIAGLASGSLALLSEAAHSTLDAGATALTYLAVRISARPPDDEHPYGHGKAENISALIETIGLLVLSTFIALAAVDRLQDPVPQVEARWYGFAVVVLSMVVDANRAWLLRREGRRLRSAALQADALHFTADLLTSTVVLIGLALVGAGYHNADAIGSLFIAGYVAYASIMLGRRSIDALMDRAPRGAAERIGFVVAGVEGVEEVRRVRVRNVGGQTQADVVIAISRRIPLETAHHVTEEVERVLTRSDPGADIIVHVEPLADEEVIAEQVEAIAARNRSISEVHNIFVTTHPEGTLISLHIKFPGEMTLGEAHEISEELEVDIMREIEGIFRVDTHLEPLDPAGVEGTDVTDQKPELIAWAKALAEGQPEVRDCHEVVLSSAEGMLSMVMHCHAEPGLSVRQVHDAATRIEDAVHRARPDVARITVHFEPQGPTDTGLSRS